MWDDAYGGAGDRFCTMAERRLAVDKISGTYNASFSFVRPLCMASTIYNSLYSYCIRLL